MFFDVPQNTDEWLPLRSGRVTGSAISKVMANDGKSFGEPAKRYAVDIANERLRGEPAIGARYNNAHMEAGHIEEPIARKLYEDMMFCTVTNGGFFDNFHTGCSPDGLVGENGVIEIKSVVPSTHYACIKRGGYDPAYHWQLMFNLKETGREWIDYVSFCEQFYAPRRLFVKRIHACECKSQFDKIKKRLDEFEDLVEQIIKDIKQ